MKDKYIAKIKKLLRLARGTSSPEEAANAIAKAQAYMRQHGISENDAELFDIQEAASAGAPSDASTPPRYMHILCDLVCKAFGVECYISGEYRASGSLKRYVRFYGPDSRPEIAAYAFDVLSRQMMAERKKYQDKHCKRCGPSTRVPALTAITAFVQMLYPAWRRGFLCIRDGSSVRCFLTLQTLNIWSCTVARAMFFVKKQRPHPVRW